MPKLEGEALLDHMVEQYKPLLEEKEHFSIFLDFLDQETTDQYFADFQKRLAVEADRLDRAVIWRPQQAPWYWRLEW